MTIYIPTYMNTTSDNIKIVFKSAPPIKLFATDIGNNLSSPQSNQYKPKIRSESKLFGVPETPNTSSHYKPGQLKSPERLDRRTPRGEYLKVQLNKSESDKLTDPQFESQSQYKSCITIYQIQADLHNPFSLKNENYPLLVHIRELIIEIGRRFCARITTSDIGEKSDFDRFEKLQIKFENIYPVWIQKMNMICVFVDQLESNYKKHNYLGLKEKLSLQIMNISISLVVLGPDTIFGHGFDVSGRNSEKFVSGLTQPNMLVTELLYLFTSFQVVKIFQLDKNISTDINHSTQVILDRLLSIVPESDKYVSDLIQKKIPGINIGAELNDFKTELSGIIHGKLLKFSSNDIRKILYKSNIAHPILPTNILDLNSSQLKEIKRNLLATYSIADKVNNFVTYFTQSMDDICHYQMVIKRKEFTHTNLLNENERLINKQIVLNKNIDKLELSPMDNAEELIINKKALEINKNNINDIPPKIKNIIDSINECKNKINLILSMIFDTIDFNYFVHVDYFPALDWGLLSNDFFDFPRVTEPVY